VDDAASLAQAVSELIKNPSLRLRLSAGARKRVRELSSRQMALATVELYADLLGSSATP
jgi:glycosyltransferase involved in cell wall biosynthesis